MADIRVSSWSELQDELFRGSWNEEIGRYRSPFVFRGLSDKTYPMDTSLMRLDGPYSELEKHLLRNFRKYAPSPWQANSALSGGFSRWHSITDYPPA